MVNYVKDRLKRKQISFGIIGGLIGLALPIGAVVFEAISHNLPLNGSSFLELHREQLLFWFVDTAPFFLGYLSSVAGKREDELGRLRDLLEQQVRERTEEIFLQKQFFEALVAHNPLAIVVLNMEQRIVSANPAFETLFGHRESDLLGKVLDEMIASGTSLTAAHALTRRVSHGDKIYSTGRRQRADGQYVDVEIHGVPVIVDGEQIGVLALYKDISERLQAEASMQTNLDREKRLIEIARLISSPLDLPSILQRVVRLASDLIGAEAAAIGLLDRDRRTITFPHIYKLPPQLTEPSPYGEGLSWEIVRNQRGLCLSEYGDHEKARERWKDAGVRAFLGAPIVAREECIGAIGLFNLRSDMQFQERDLGLLEAIGLQAGIAIEKARLFDDVHQLSITDPLTGLFNRRHFDKQIASEFKRAQRYHRRLGLMIIDPDNFKNVNDTFGHIVGDDVLRNLAQTIRENMRESDIVARYGGDEIVVILPEIDLDGVITAAEKIRNVLKNTHFHAGETTVTIGVSIGAAAMPDHNPQTSDELILLADNALYKAKNRGRDQVVSAA